MSWIYSSGALTQPQMENNATIAYNLIVGKNVNPTTIYAILSNMQNESSINPTRREQGGEGYGLIQWTPQSVLINNAATLGYSDYNNGDTQCIVAIEECKSNSAVNSWYSTEAFISPYYNSGATPDMVGITGDQFLSNAMGWSADKLAILYMAARLRPSYDPDTNHAAARASNALDWQDFFGGVPPDTGKPIPSWVANKWVQYGAISETIRKRFYM